MSQSNFLSRSRWRRASGPLLACALALGAGSALEAAGPSPSHAVTIRSTPKYGPDFTHFDYVNPRAPKGGTLRLAAIGTTFDTLNPFVLKGNPAGGITSIFDTLTESSLDEANVSYGHVAQSIEVSPAGDWVIFRLRPEARFHDGSPMTPADVIFSFQTLKTKGHPFFRAYYADVRSATAHGERGVKFSFGPGVNQELPAILGQLPVLSKAYWSDRDFEKTTLEAPLGSGPYRVKEVDQGRSIVYERVADYWARDLATKRGQDNFDHIRYDYYRDSTVALEAFKAGEYDFKQENNSKLWATGYASPALERGLIVKELIPHELPAGMQSFIYNTRRPQFRDRLVRKALAYAFDFEWTNKHLFYGQYKRSTSFFTNSELAARGLPSPEELALLRPFESQLPAEVFTEAYQPPRTDGSGNIRSQLRAALSLLKQAGWRIEDKQLVHPQTEGPFRFEMLLVSPDFERVVLPMKKNLERLGIEMTVRTVDPAQYQKRLDEFDFDVIVGNFGITLSPGNEQRDYWHSSTADRPGSRNRAGVKDPVVDALVEQVIAAPDREALVHRTRALDRVLLWGHYVIPNWHIDKFRVAYWDKFERPALTPKYGLGLSTWWFSPEKAERLEAVRAASG